MAELQKFAARHDASPETVRRWIVESMLLGAVADGEIDHRESEAIISEILIRPELHGMDRDELRRDLEWAWRGLEADGFQARMHALAGALPRYAHRVLAFRGAVVVALADGKLVDDELGFLRQMQRVLGIVEADVVRAFDDAEGGGLAIPEEVEPIEAYLDVLLLAAAADGAITLDERVLLQAFVAERAEFDGLAPEMLAQYLTTELERYAREGAGPRLLTLAEDLPDPIHRLNAYGLAEDMALADGDLDEAELSLLRQLALVLDLDGARLAVAGDGGGDDLDDEAFDD